MSAVSTPERAETRSTDRSTSVRLATVPRLRRLPLVLGLCALTVALVWTGHGLLGFVLVVAGLAIALAGDRSSLANLPAAFVLALVANVAVTMAVPLLGGSLRAQWAARAVLTAFAIGVALTGYVRRGAIERSRLFSGAEAVAALPAAVFAGVGVGLTFTPVATATAWFFRGTDNVNHLHLVGELQARGELNYLLGGSAYPRGWHSLNAVLATASSEGDEVSRSSMFSGLTELATSTWLLYSLLVLVVALVVVRMVRGMASGVVAANVGLFAGATMLLPSFLLYTLGFGAETKLLFAVVLLTTCLELFARATPPASGILAACVVGASHSWQVGLPLVALGFVLGLVLTWRQSRPGTRRLAVLRSLCWGSAAAALSLPPVLSMFIHVSPTETVSAAAERGADVGSVPWLWLALGLLASADVLIRRRGLGGPLFMAAVVVAMSVLSLLVVVVAHVPLTSYYPNKVLWFACLVGVPLAWAGIARKATRWQTQEGSRALRTVLSATSCLALGAMLGYGGLVSWAAASGAWTKVDTGTILTAVSTDGARNAQLAWRVGNGPYEDVITRRMLEYYRTRAGQPTVTLRPLSHEEECAVLERSTTPTVLSAESPASVRRAFACILDLHVVQVDPHRP